jgi:hypothetical protein
VISSEYWHLRDDDSDTGTRHLSGSGSATEAVRTSLVCARLEVDDHCAFVARQGAVVRGVMHSPDSPGPLQRGGVTHDLELWVLRSESTELHAVPRAEVVAMTDLDARRSGLPEVLVVLVAGVAFSGKEADDYGDGDDCRNAPKCAVRWGRHGRESVVPPSPRQARSDADRSRMRPSALKRHLSAAGPERTPQDHEASGSRGASRRHEQEPDGSSRHRQNVSSSHEVNALTGRTAYRHSLCTIARQDLHVQPHLFTGVGCPSAAELQWHPDTDTPSQRLARGQIRNVRIPGTRRAGARGVDGRRPLAQRASRRPGNIYRIDENEALQSAMSGVRRADRERDCPGGLNCRRRGRRRQSHEAMVGPRAGGCGMADEQH